MAYKTLIFDLGNVLISFSYEKMFSQIGKLIGTSPEEVQEFLIEQRIGLQFERGLLSNEEIFSLFHQIGKKPFDMSDFFYASSAIFSSKEEMLSLVKKLKEIGYQLLILSNTCEPHINYISNHYAILPLFDHMIFSYELGIAKPEEAIYRYALKKAIGSPSECFFVDDQIENIQAAEMLGITSHHFVSPPILMNDLMRHEII